jgi:phosphoglycolate phosphatase-like HAD superfamily hydrolase
VGDRLRDIAAAERFGGRGILVGSGEAGGFPAEADLAAAVGRILVSE